MTLATYSELSAAIIDYMDDASLSTKTDTFIALAEARFNRVLDTIDQQQTTTLDGSGTSIALPSDYYEVRGLYLNGQYTLPLEALTVNALKSLYPDNLSGVPLAYAIDGPNIVLGPLPNATCTLTLNYKAKMQGLSGSATTNWLLTKHPDLYLVASLVAAELRGWNDGRLPILKSAADEMIMEINEAGKKAKIAAGPLRMRATITETGRSTGGNTGNLLTDGTDFLVDG
jgi:hypothetical protein